MTWGRGPGEVVLSVAAGSAVFVLGCEMEVLGMPRLSGLTLRSTAEIGEAADAALALVWALEGEVAFAAVRTAARQAYLALSKDAGHEVATCSICLLGVHPAGIHSVEARFGSDAGLGSGAVCACSCNHDEENR